MTLALTSNGYWVLALVLGTAAAVVVAILLTVLIGTVGRIQESVEGLLEVAGKVASNTALTVVLSVVVVLVLAAALIIVRRRLERISEGLATLSSALQGVESEHLRPLEPAVEAINAQFEIILGALPGIAGKAAMVAERTQR
ncbi:MAG: hypothetical protein K0S82_170 [Gaiellaceae bacterium]|nr:hypothetical protein [Gaiellaceae bacterium]